MTIRAQGPYRLAPLFAVLLLSTLLLAGCASMQRAHDAALMLADMHAGTADSALKQRTDPPSVEALRYRVGSHTQLADRYQSAESPRGSLVLIHGFTEYGRRDPRLVAFAYSLARSGFRVLAPELPALTDMSLGSAERDQIATALRFATRDGGSTGLAAMSLAAGPAILAATEADIAGRIGYILLVGAYYDITDVIRYATTGVDAGSDGSGNSAEVPLPMREGKWILLLSQLHHIDDPADRDALRTIAERSLQDENAPIQPWLEKLSEPGRALYELMVNTEPDRVEPLIAKLPPAVRDELAALNLAQHDIGALQARLLLIHGANDPIIPVSQSERLLAAVPDGRADLFSPPGLDHVDLSANLRDGWHLWRAARKLLALAEESR